LPRLADCLSAWRKVRLAVCFIRIRPGAHLNLVRADVSGPHAASLGDFRLLDLRCNRRNDAAGHLFLHCENVFKHTVKALGPGVV